MHRSFLVRHPFFVHNISNDMYIPLKDSIPFGKK